MEAVRERNGTTVEDGKARRGAARHWNDYSESALGHMKTTYGDVNRGRDGVAAP